MGESEASGEQPTSEARPSTSVEEEPETVSPPADFGARARAFTISLTWLAGAEEPEPDVQVLFRDGVELARLAGDATSYRDDNVVPGREYAYEIEAHAGELVSERAALQARTSVPPLRAARVAGVFNVRTKEESASGYVERSVPTFGWQLHPRCGEGACNVRWNDLRRKRVRALLERRGARYHGTYRGFFNVLCAGAQVTSVVEIRLKVEAARAIAGRWRATRLTGTLSQSEASQLGCVSAHQTLSLRARLLR